jgi:succinate dehydrogenase / fumarate reductase, cytochrome b subunit
MSSTSLNSPQTSTSSSNNDQRAALSPGRTPLLTTVGKKYVMAFSGLALVGFVITHLLGNLTLYSRSGDPFNAYAFKLHSFGILLVLAEIGLLGVFLVHILFAFGAKRSHWAARPQGYKVWRSKGGPKGHQEGLKTPSNLSSRNMIISGVALLAFVALHVWQFRFGPGLGEGYTATIHGEEARDLHRLIVETFKNPAWTALYVVMMIFLGLHLRHGFWSAFQSAGLTRRDTSPVIMALGVTLSVVLAVGFLFIPVFIYFVY